MQPSWPCACRVSSFWAAQPCACKPMCPAPSTMIHAAPAAASRLSLLRSVLVAWTRSCSVRSSSAQAATGWHYGMQPCTAVGLGLCLTPAARLCSGGLGHLIEGCWHIVYIRGCCWRQSSADSRASCCWTIGTVQERHVNSGPVPAFCCFTLGGLKLSPYTIALLGCQQCQCCATDPEPG